MHTYPCIMSEPLQPREVRDVEELRALAHPMRQRILGRLHEGGHTAATRSITRSSASGAVEITMSMTQSSQGQATVFVCPAASVTYAMDCPAYSAVSRWRAADGPARTKWRRGRPGCI